MAPGKNTPPGGAPGAAAALAHGLKRVTRNAKNLERAAGLSLFSPLAGSAAGTPAPRPPRFPGAPPRRPLPFFSLAAAAVCG